MDPAAVVLFDGDCNLCSRAVRFILERDPHGRFYFASLHSESASRLLAEHPEHVAGELDTVILLQDGRLYTRSTAALRIAGQLRGPIRIARFLLALPQPLRDAAYRWVARNRIRWFGTADMCALAPPAQRDRFL